ncbi:acyl-homoserine-lactone synthase [Candidatus Arsenophonus triatominarum]|uniref:acyl-homoserine-lactone synthase n=1 Tax=Candidatus Arsenophonus triatominarum TaxID=57911 RepID=UPI0007C55619|nr:acyl-homoserine-lactone synthase [Candidatus Arsenophonus triatominarum]
MLEIFDVNYNLLTEKKSKELFTLRKETFKDRLNWAVNCINGMEFDEYDNDKANYLFGVRSNTIICSVRFIEMQFPNMITGTFAPFFKHLNLPKGNYIESSRFFVAKDRTKELNCDKYPVFFILCLAMINYAQKGDYDGILTIISHGMLKVVERSGWEVSIIEQGLSEKNEKVYLLLLPIDSKNQNKLIGRIRRHYDRLVNNNLKKWPLIYPSFGDRLNEL